MEKVLIDYAEVLSNPFPEKTMAELAQRVGMSTPDFQERYWRHRAPYDTGQSSREYWESVVGSNYKLDDEELSSLVQIDVKGWLDLNPAATQWLAELNELGIRPWLLSNAPHPLADAIDDLPIASAFEGMIFSARIGMAKPSQECFAAATKAMQSTPAQILFIDDRSANISAAAEFGMNTFLFTGEFPTLSQA